MKNQLIKNYEHFIQTLILLKKRPLLFSLSMIIDLIFTIILLFLLSAFFSIYGVNRAKIEIETQFSLSLETISSMNQILNFSLIYILLLFILFLLMQSNNWFIANKILKNKINYLNYIKKFSLISLIYFILITLFIYFPLRIFVISLFENTFYLRNLSLIIIPILLVLMIIHLSILDYKKLFKKIYYFIIPSIIIVTLFFLVELLSNLFLLLGIKGIYLTILTGIIFFKVISFSRIFLIKKSKEIN